MKSRDIEIIPEWTTLQYIVLGKEGRRFFYMRHTKQETLLFVQPEESRGNWYSRNRPAIIWSKRKHPVLAYLIYTIALGHYSRSLMAFCAWEGSGDDLFSTFAQNMPIAVDMFEI